MIKPRSHLLQLAPYVLPDTSAPSGKRLLHLAQNESAIGPSPHATEAMQQAITTPNLYPDPDCSALRAAIADVHGLPADQILCGCGSLSLIALIAVAYLDAEQSAVCSEHSYLYFRSAVKIANAEVLIAAEDELVVDVDALLEAVRPNTQIVFLANPGNPTGTLISHAEIVRLRQNLRPDIMLIVDEAYAEYVPPADYQPAFNLVELGNTVVLRTFSKIYGLAGMRVGWGYFPPKIIDILRRVQIPNGVTAVAQAAATAAMRDQTFATHVRAETAAVRSWFTQVLRDCGLNPQPSFTNFVLCHLPSEQAAQALNDYLRSEGIIVRQMRGYDMPDRIRITLGTSAQMEEVAAALQMYVSQH